MLKHLLLEGRKVETFITGKGFTLSGFGRK